MGQCLACTILAARFTSRLTSERQTQVLSEWPAVTLEGSGAPPSLTVEFPKERRPGCDDRDGQSVGRLRLTDVEVSICKAMRDAEEDGMNEALVSGPCSLGDRGWKDSGPTAWSYLVRRTTTVPARTMREVFRVLLAPPVLRVRRPSKLGRTRSVAWGAVNVPFPGGTPTARAPSPDRGGGWTALVLLPRAGRDVHRDSVTSEDRSPGLFP